MKISFENCRDLLHEFGHAIHSLLSETEFQSLSGTRIPLDFAEVPSHFFEKFIYDYEFCKKWMIDRNTDFPITYENHHALAADNLLFESLRLEETIYNSLVDLKLHQFKNESHVTEENLIEIMKRENYFSCYKFNFTDEFFEKFSLLYNHSNLETNKIQAFYHFQEELIKGQISSTTENEKLTQLLDLINQNRYTFSNPQEIYRDELTFIMNPHLTDYPSIYYSYVVGKVYASYIWSRLDNVSMSKIGHILRKEFLSKGYNQSPEVLLENIAGAFNNRI